MISKGKKGLSFFIATALLAVTLTGCGSSTPATSAPAPSSPAAGSASSVAADPSAPVDRSNRPKITMFMSDSGVPTPDGVDVSDNRFINIVEDYAGVDLEIVQPAYADFQTKFNLMMSSGQLPDIVHTYFLNDALSYAEQGAFIDLKPYYDKSPAVQAIITPEVMELTKTDSGKYFRIPQTSVGHKQGYGNVVRYDLLTEYNGGKFPTDVDGYVEFLRWVKKTYPDSIPLSARATDTKIFLYGEVFFKWYGAMPQSYNVVDGKVVSTFVLPEYRAAVELYRQLYSEGILDKEFATNDPNTFASKVATNNVALTTDLPMSIQVNNINLVANAETSSQLRLFTPELEKYPEVVSDPVYTKAFKQSPANIHGLYISSGSKNKDLAWKVIEGFTSPELRELATWGEEGVQYTVKDGKRVPDAKALADENQKFSTHLMLIPGFNAVNPSKDAIAEQEMGTEKYKMLTDSMAHVANEAEERGYAIFDVFRYTATLLTDPDDFKAKKEEIDKYTAEATVNAITGKISMEEFDKRVANYKTQYAFVDESLTKAVNDKRDFLLSVGCKEAGR